MKNKISVLIISLFFLVSCSKPDDTQYTVSFNSNGGNDIPVQIVRAGSNIKEVAPVNKGFVFAGWYYDSELLLKFKYENPINRDLTLYGQWTPTSLNVSAISYSSNTNGITSFAQDMIFDNAGNLCLSTGDGIYKISASGAVSTFVTGAYSSMSFDSNGNLFALLPENFQTTIHKIDINGNVTIFKKVDFFVADLVFDKKTGVLFVSDANHGKLNKIDANGNISEFASYAGIGDFTIDPFGNYYIGNYLYISKIDLEGRNSSFSSSDRFGSYSLICDSKGNLYTTSTFETISKITPTGAVVSFKLDGSMGSIRGMTIDKDDNIYVDLSNGNGNFKYINTILKITY